MPGSRTRVVRSVAALVVALAVGLPATATAAAGAPVEARLDVSARRGQLPDGPFAVGVRQFTFVDPSRPTAANGTAPALPSRTLATTVLYPAEGAPGPGELPDAPAHRGSGRFPLVVFGHGFTSNGPTQVFLLRQIAAAGYVVALPTFPLSSGGAPGGPNLGDVVNQPADISFVIDELLRLNRDPSSGLRSVLHPSRIGVGGHSLGGLTTVGFLSDCCADPRVDALVPISGAQFLVPGTYYDDAVPLLLIHGDQDGTVPYGASTLVFDRAQPPKYLLTLLGAGHVPFFGATGDALVDATIAFLDRYLKGRRPALDRLRSQGNRPGVATLQGVEP